MSDSTTKYPTNNTDWLKLFYTNSDNSKTIETMMMIHRALVNTSNLGQPTPEDSPGVKLLASPTNYTTPNDQRELDQIYQGIIGKNEQIHKDLLIALTYLGYYHHRINHSSPDMGTIGHQWYLNVLRYYDHMPLEIQNFYETFLTITTIKHRNRMNIGKFISPDKWHRITDNLSNYQIVFRQAESDKKMTLFGECLPEYLGDTLSQAYFNGFNATQQIEWPDIIELHLNMPSIVRQTYINEIMPLIRANGKSQQVTDICSGCIYQYNDKTGLLYEFDKNKKLLSTEEGNDLNNIVTPKLVCKLFGASSDRACDEVDRCARTGKCLRLLASTTLLTPIDRKNFELRYSPLAVITLLKSLGVRLVPLIGNLVWFESYQQYITRITQRQDIISQQAKDNIKTLIELTRQDERYTRLLNPGSFLDIKTLRKSPDDPTPTENILMLQKHVPIKGKSALYGRFMFGGSSSSLSISHPDYRRNYLTSRINFQQQPFALNGIYGDYTQTAHAQFGGSLSRQKLSKIAEILLNTSIAKLQSKNFHLREKDKLKIQKVISQIKNNEKILVQSLAKLKTYGLMYNLTNNAFFDRKYLKAENHLQRANKNLQIGGRFVMKTFEKMRQVYLNDSSSDNTDFDI